MSHPFFTGEFALRKERLLATATGRVLNLEGSSLNDPSHEPGSFDTVITVHTLCSVPDLDAAVRRIDDLLAPHGRVLLLEHVPVFGSSLWRLSPYGCRTNRDLFPVLRRHGFAITDCDRFKQPRVLPIVASHISAIAIRKVRPSMQEQAMNETGV